MANKDYSGYPNRITLDIELLSSDEYPGSAFMVFDLDFPAVFGTKGKVPVKFTVNDHTYRSTIAVYDGVHMMVFNRQMREETGYKAGDRIHAILERDTDERKVEIPEDVQKAMAQAGVLELFTGKSYSHQKEHIAWINDTKKQATRERRIAKLVEVLGSNG